MSLQRSRTRTAAPLRGSCASFRVASKRSSTGLVRSITIAFSEARLFLSRAARRSRLALRLTADVFAILLPSGTCRLRTGGFPHTHHIHPAAAPAHDGQVWNGMSNFFSNAFASASVRAVVTNWMSMPRIASTLS